MKKLAGLPLLLLASIIILVHAVIPHHHHNGMVVPICISEAFDRDHEHDHNFPYHYSQKSDPHSHDEEFSEDCLFFPPFTVALNHRIEIKDYGNLPFRQKPYIAFSYNHYVTHSLGLRAPPVC